MSDRKALIRLASSLPKGSKERKAILAGLKKTAQSGKTAADDNWHELVVQMKDRPRTREVEKSLSASIDLDVEDVSLSGKTVTLLVSGSASEVTRALKALKGNPEVASIKSRKAKTAKARKAAPKGSKERKAILAGLKKTAGPQRLLVYNTYGVVSMDFKKPVPLLSDGKIGFKGIKAQAKEMQRAVAAVEARIQQAHPKVQSIATPTVWLEPVGSELWVVVYADFDMKKWTQGGDFTPADWDELKSLLGTKILGYTVEVDPKPR